MVGMVSELGADHLSTFFLLKKEERNILRPCLGFEDLDVR